MRHSFSTPPAQPGLILRLREALALTDAFAYANVTQDKNGNSLLDASGNPIDGGEPRGGPFGAVLAISLPDGSLEIVGPVQGNNVIGSGIASQHAEDRAMQPAAYEALTQRLLALRKQDQDPTVWMISSGQSCPSCQAKQEIMARDLIACGLIQPDRFMTLFGATYDETFEIAQFNDAQYADALILAQKDPTHKGNLIQRVTQDFADVPLPVRKRLAEARCATAIVMRGDRVYAEETEAREMFDPFSTAEVSAIRAACRRYRDEKKVVASWEVDGVLYTTTREIGALALTEASWTHISKIVSVEMPPALASKQFETREVPGFANASFRAVVAQGYQCPGSAVRVFHDEGYKNTAQAMWQRVLARNGIILYNGAEVSNAVLGEHNEMRFRFASLPLSDYGKPRRGMGLPVALRPLEKLHPMG